MLSLDTNLLFYAFNSDSPQHLPALQFIKDISTREDVVISEFVLAEFYLLLRNPAALPKCLDNASACAVIATYRQHPRWQIVGFPTPSQPFHDELWQSIAADPLFPRRKLFDLRLGLSLRFFGVKEFATANLKDFAELDFLTVWNPLNPENQQKP